MMTVKGIRKYLIGNFLNDFSRKKKLIISNRPSDIYQACVMVIYNVIPWA